MNSKIALVHDYLNQYGGGERVLEVLAEIWPKARIYTSLVDKKIMKNWVSFPLERIKTNFISKLPFANYLSKHYFFLYPLAFRLQNLGNADIIFSTTSYAAKFVRGKKGSVHICYLHTPPRFLWGYDTELGKYYSKPFDKYLSFLYKIFLPPIKIILRKFDYNAAQKVDFFIANSKEVQKRIKKHYNRDSIVIYPPVDTLRFQGKISDQGYYLIVSRLGGYKKVDIAVEAFNKLGKKLKVVGTGPQFDYLKSIAAANIEMLGRIADDSVTGLYKNCTAVIFPTYEDFGIVPLEAMAAGKPVVAFKAGGALETVVEGKTGIFFEEQTPESIIKAVKEFEKTNFDSEICRKQSSKFSKEVFENKIREFVESKVKGNLYRAK